MGYRALLYVHAYMASGVRVSQAYLKPYPETGAYWKLLGTASAGVRPDGTPLHFATSDAVHHGVQPPPGPASPSAPIHLKIKVKWPAGWREFDAALTDSGQTFYYEPTAADLVPPPTLAEWVRAKLDAMIQPATGPKAGTPQPVTSTPQAPTPLPGTAVIEAQGATRLQITALRLSARVLVAQGTGPFVAFAAQPDPVEVWIAWTSDAGASGRTSTHLLMPAAQTGVVQFTDPAAPVTPAPMDDEIVPLPSAAPTPLSSAPTPWIPPEAAALAVPAGIGAGVGLLAGPTLGIGRGAGAVGGAVLGVAARLGWGWWQDRASASASASASAEPVELVAPGEPVAL